MELEEKTKDFADRCVACTSCVAVCPVTKVNLDYKGPKLVGPAHNRLHYSDKSDFEWSLKWCSNCKNCDITCPQGVSVSTLNMLERAKYYHQHPDDHSLTDQVLCHGSVIANLIDKIPYAAQCANLGMNIGKKLNLLEPILGLAGQRSLPQYATRFFRKRFPGIHQPTSNKKVVFFTGCYIDGNDPEVGVDFVRVMNENGYEVLLDNRFVCCGSPLLSGGYLDEVRANADKNTAVIREYAEKNIPVVACCTSCSLMLKQEYTELFAQSEYKDAAANVYDAFEFLALLSEKGELKPPTSSLGDTKYLYHAPCHLRAQSFGLPALDILQNAGVNITYADAGCCGISGNYGFKKENYTTSMAIGAKLFSIIKNSGVETVVCDCGTCREQIKHGIQRNLCGNADTTIHPIRLLAKTYQPKN